MNTIEIYADGACKGNPGRGGWGALIKGGGLDKEMHGGENNTTNNRMELTAVLEALKSLPKGSKVVVYTDSQYVKDGITSWIRKWKINGWKTAKKEPVKNAELWRELDAAQDLHTVQWRWVKGHAGNPGNERADQLANIGVLA